MKNKKKKKSKVDFLRIIKNLKSIGNKITKTLKEQVYFPIIKN